MKDERRGEIEVKLRYFKDLYIHVYRGDFINFFFFFVIGYCEMKTSCRAKFRGSHFYGWQKIEKLFLYWYE